jgi:ribosomal protein L29
MAKIKKIEDITTADVAVLMEEIAKARNTIREHTFAVAGAKPQASHEVRTLKKHVARVLTELNRRKRQ